MCPEGALLPNLDPRFAHAPAILGRPSQPQARLAVGGARGPAEASRSPHSQSGAGSCVKPSQSNNSASALVKNPEPSSSPAGPKRHLCPATTNPGLRPSPYPMDPMAKRQHPPRCRRSPRQAPQLSGPHMPIRTTTARCRLRTITTL